MSLIKKTIFASLAALGVAAPAAAEDDVARPAVDHMSCNGADNEIFVVISNVERSVGLIAADLYPRGEETFLKGSKGRLKKVTFAAKAPVTTFCIQAPEADEYAIALYHDENANGDLDKGAFGIPSEPYGISNNPKIRFGPPSNAESLFSVAPGGVTVEIELKG